MPEAKNHAETYHRHGEADPSNWDEAEAVTGRPVDAVPTNSSFAERAKAGAAENKQVQTAEAKSDEDDKPAKRSTRRKSTAKKS